MRASALAASMAIPEPSVLLSAVTSPMAAYGIFELFVNSGRQPPEGARELRGSAQPRRNGVLVDDERRELTDARGSVEALKQAAAVIAPAGVQGIERHKVGARAIETCAELRA